jgi:hypothetical protein
MSTPTFVTEDHRRIAANAIGQWSPRDSFNENLNRFALVIAQHDEEKESELAKLRGKIYALEKAGDAMELLLTGSMKPSKGVREAWQNAKKL